MCLFFSVVAEGQTFTFECVCAQLTGDTCDICPTNPALASRSFNGLLIRRNGTPYKWIDEPYTIKRFNNESIQFLEMIPNPDQVTIALFQTPFSTMNGYVDSTNCVCNDNGGAAISDTLFFVDDGATIYPITPGDTLVFPDSLSGAGCPCCDSLIYWPSDTIAHNVGGLNQGDYYVSSQTNIYGLPWGIVKLLSEPTTFSGALPPGCIANVSPPATLAYYISDSVAVLSGLLVGDYYLSSSTNIYGLPTGVLKRIVP